MTTPRTIKAEYERATAVEEAQALRIAALEALAKPPVVIDPGATVVVPGVDDAKALMAAGKKNLLLRGDALTPHRFALGSVPTQFRGVSIRAYPGDSPVIDGAGLDPHLVYLDSASGTWKIFVPFRNFRPVDSGVIGIGTGARLETGKGAGGVGMGRPGLPYDINSHGYYFHGGSGLIEDTDLTGFPGAALHFYKGSSVVVVNRGHFGAFYESILVGTGADVTLNRVAMVEPAAAVDLQLYLAEGPAKVALSGCTGTGPGGSVRRK